ncbi:heme ABC transporter ATP-binding protein [Pseudoalteromonas sp. 2CM39R]|uniref:heme ABC transporter ATP-binding protein n=1 Tax=Pseudoalteromonas sp. 2CM39R TaxID=2929856 RepID=UPI0020BD68EA|nr:heme ABC transporter ATP-binding protein [Pseudoalteromonas sp. 2CM39R]MCK8125917.1 heme ABC transporter ATP-binding protein [Pseudoalteromonas sp. 2CM39R]
MLSFNHLSVNFGEKAILQDLTSEIKAGQCVGLIGENGAGKSTLLHTLAGSHSYQGEILLNNQPLAKFSQAKLAHQRAVVMQSQQLGFAFTVQELVAMGRYPYKETTQHCAKKVAQYIDFMELGHLRDRRATALSGGELQRVSMARCLAQLDAFSDDTQPKLMLLDEPTSALDMRHQHALLGCVNKFVEQGNAAIIAIHDLNLASLYTSDIIMLHQKHILASGRTSDVLTEHNLKHIYAMPLYVKSHPLHDAPMIYSQRQEFS